MPKQPFRHDDHMYLYIYKHSNRETRPIQFAVRNDLAIPASFTRGIDCILLLFKQSSRGLFGR